MEDAARLHPRPDPVASMSLTEKLEGALKAALPRVPQRLQAQFRELLKPKSLAIMAGVATVYAGAQFVGVGEVADVALLATGAVLVGKDAIGISKDLVEFVERTKDAKSQHDLSKAGAILAAAVTIASVDVAQAVTHDPGIGTAEDATRIEALSARDESALVNYSYGAQHLPHAPERSAQGFGQFVRDRVEHVRREVRQHWHRPHTDIGTTIDHYTSAVIAESSPGKFVGKLVVGSGLTALGVDAIRQHVRDNLQHAQDEQRISQRDGLTSELQGVVQYRNAIGQPEPFRDGDVHRGRIVSFDARGTLVQQVGSERIEYDAHSLLQHAADPQLMLKTIEQTQARGDLLELRADRGRIGATEIARPRSQGRSR